MKALHMSLEVGTLRLMRRVTLNRNVLWAKNMLRSQRRACPRDLVTKNLTTHDTLEVQVRASGSSSRKALDPDPSSGSSSASQRANLNLNLGSGSCVI